MLLLILLFSLEATFANDASCDAPAPIIQKNSSLQNLEPIKKKIELCRHAMQMEIHGHRGIEGFPNNTLSSFEGGIRAGATTLELDLQATKDNQIIVAHDPTLNTEMCTKPDAVTNQKEIPFRSLTLAQVKTIRCGNDHIPTLNEVFEKLKNAKTTQGLPPNLNIEIKFQDGKKNLFPDLNSYTKWIARDIKKGGWDNKRILVQSFSQDSLTKINDLNPKLRISPLLGNPTEALAAATKLGAKTVTVYYKNLTESTVRELHKQKIKVIPWTVNEESEMQRLLAMGVDGIITDHADRFIQVRKEFCQGLAE